MILLPLAGRLSFGIFLAVTLLAYVSVWGIELASSIRGSGSGSGLKSLQQESSVQVLVYFSIELASSIKTTATRYSKGSLDIF